MTEQDYNVALLKIEHNYSASKKQLAIDYAKFQRKFKVGDIVKDRHGVIIQVETFGVYAYGKFPKPTYKGRALRKDLVPKKNIDTETIYGNDDVELLKSV